MNSHNDSEERKVHKAYAEFKEDLDRVNEVDPAEFKKALEKEADRCQENIDKRKKELVELKKKKAKTGDYEEIKDIESDIFWAEHWMKKNVDKLKVLDRILVELGWETKEDEDGTEQVESSDSGL